MKNLRKIYESSILFVVLIACNPKDKDDQSKNTVSKERTYYTCSMDPQVKEDKSGKCPICFMELTPIKQGDNEPNEISLSSQQLQLGNITTQAVSQTQIDLDQYFTGVLTINQEKIKTISARVMGRIDKLYYKTIGDYVEANRPVYELYSEDLAIAKRDYYTAYKQDAMSGDFAKYKENILNSAKQKLLFYGLTNAQIESIETNKEVSPYTVFYSSSSGTISEITSTEGSYAMEGSSIVKLADLNSLWLEAQVNVNYAKELKIGQNAQITFEDFPDKVINARVSFINPEINPDSRLLLIRFEIPNFNLQLKPGMQAVAKITQSRLNGLYLPIGAVIREENASYIWVEKRPGVFENVMVETGIETNGMIEIKSEMDLEKRVVITGAFAVNSEYKFRKGSNPMEGMKM